MARKKHQHTSVNTNAQSSSNNTNNIQETLLEIKLIKLGVLVSILSIAAGFIFIASSRKSLNVLYAQLQGIELPVIPPTAAQLVVAGAIVGLTSNLLFATTTDTRMKQLIRTNLNGTNDTALASYSKINSGAFIGLIGSLFLTSGAIRREQETRIIVV
jgi:hypothetical protein